MIIWIASYPKSGNTYIRSFVSAYYFTPEGRFDFDKLKNIKQFPNVEFFNFPIKNAEEASNSWLVAQKKIKDEKKIKFLKTHNCLGSYKGNPFTTLDYTLGAVYIVRDPRNVITSIMNHYSYDLDEAYEFMVDTNRSIKSDFDDYSTYSQLSSWGNHYKSWTNTKNLRKLIIRYEDLENNKYETFRDIIVFLNTVANRTERVNKEKLQNSIETTNFTVLKNLEKSKGFNEAIYSSKEKRKKTFFNLGFNNRWKKLLPSEMIKKIEKEFSNEMKDLGYL